jgi:hypothetical protein
VTRREHAEHQRRATEAPQELAPPDAEPTRLVFGRVTGAANRLDFHGSERERTEFTVRAGPELDGQLGIGIPPIHATTLDRTIIATPAVSRIHTYDPRVVSLASPAHAILAAADPANVGDLAGNLPLGVYLLIPLVLALAILTSLALGSGAEPRATGRRVGGVSRALRSGDAHGPAPD